MLLAAALLAGAAATTPAQDVAEVSTRVCYALASGAATLPAANGAEGVAAQDKAIEALGVRSGLDKVALDGLGPIGTATVSQTIMGHRANGTARTVVAVGGRMSGCRTLMLADADAGATEAVAAALAAQGWKPVPAMTQTTASMERRVFLRRDSAGKPYLLNLLTPTAAAPASGRLRLITSVAAIPPGVQLPEGY